ncbi:MAG: hypothetical protein RI907_3648 [Pseudomonadota bacterium]|jgi:uncharacterized protein (TIGR02099 family)
MLLAAVLAWGALLVLILPRVDTWRDALAQQATKALGLSVQIGAVQGWREGIWPVLSLKDVQFVDAQGRPGLRLPEVRARISITTLSPRALADRELRLADLALIRPELDVRRDADGHISVAGFALPEHPTGGDDAERGLDWVLSQARIRIEQGSVRWSDATMGASVLSLQEVDVSLDNHSGLGRRTHSLRVAATPPAGFGRRFELSTTQTQPLWQVGAKVQAVGQHWPWWQRWHVQPTRPSQWSTWSGDVAIVLPWVDVQHLRQHVHLPIEVDGGQGQLRADLQWRLGQPQLLKLQGELQSVALKLASDLQPLAFKRLAGSFTVAHADERSDLAYDQLSFELADGQVWPASSGSLVWRHTRWPDKLGDAVWALTTGGEAKADRLDVALLARIADRLPLGPGVRQVLADLAPQGEVRQASWRWEGVPDAPRSFQASADVLGLSLAPAEASGRPGLHGASGHVEATEAGGHAELKMQAGWLAFPGLFEQAQIPLDKLQAQVHWQVKPATATQPAQWRVDVNQVTFTNADATGQLEGSWQTAGWLAPATSRLPGRLQLGGRLERAQATSVWRYLPMTLPASARHYVRDAILSGVGEKVQFEVNGDLDAFPFPEDKGGRFRVRVPVRDVRLDYVPARLLSDHGEAPSAIWPAFTQLQGLLSFEGQRLVIREASGRLGTVGSGTFAMHNVAGQINDLGAADPHLTIQGQGEGPLEDALKFLGLSPIGEWTGQVMAPARAQGHGKLNLSLDIPLDHTIDTHVQGEVLLPEDGSASLRMQPGLPQLARLTGRIGFTESELKVKAHAHVWGNPMEITGHRIPNGQIRFDAQGPVTAASLAEAREFAVLPILAPQLSGEAPVRVTIAMNPDAQGHLPPGPTVWVQSSMQGMQGNWPAPMNKAPAATWPLKVTYRPDDPQGLKDAISVELGQASPTTPQLQVEIRRDVSGPHARFLRGSIQLWQGTMAAPSALVLPASGMSAQVMVPLVDVDAWLPVVRQLQADASQAPTAGGESAEVYLPRSVAVKTALLQFKQRSLKDVAGTLAHPSQDVWHAQLDAAQVAGQVDWLPDAGGGQKLVARLSRLAIPQAEAQALADQAAEQLTGGATTRLPAVDVVIDRFDWRGITLGKLEVLASNRAVSNQAQPEWRLQRFQVSNPEAKLNAEGQWALAGGATRGSGRASALSRSSFQFNLDVANSGNLLTRLGLPKTVQGGKGNLTGQISWQGSPLEPDPLSMLGDIRIKISEGQFLKVDPGMAKLLGVLSLQSLPRRLTLDFRDLFEQGFAFDGIDGDVAVGQGMARTRNLRMRGVTAVVLMEGEADLARETQDIHVFVVPEINAGGASLAYAAINPVVGLGTFVAQWLLRKQVAAAGTQEFRVSGPWSDPTVEKLQLKDLDKPAAEGAASATAASPSPARSVQP